MNYLRPGIKRGNISEDEEDLIVRLHSLLGNRWSLIAGRLPGRTDNEIKNYWNTHLLKKLKSAGFEPRPHKEIPKPATTAAAAPAGGKKKKKQKKAEKKEEANNPPEKTKVYLPKPIRAAPMFPRTDSFDSLASGTSSSDPGEKLAAAAVESYSPVVAAAEAAPWPPSIFDVCSGGGGGDGDEEDFLGGGFILPVLRHADSMSSDVDMLEKVYDEYLQLLQEN